MKNKKLTLAVIMLLSGASLLSLSGCQTYGPPAEDVPPVEEAAPAENGPAAYHQDYLAAQLLAEGSVDEDLEESEELLEVTGTHFEATDSSIVVDTSAEVTMLLEASGQELDMGIEPGSATTSFTVSGLTPSTPYYLYKDSYHSETVLSTDASGAFTFELDISAGRSVWIQSKSSLTNTVQFISDDGIGGTGGDCVSIGGNWDGLNKTCTLTQNLPIGDSIQIDSPGLTLDCSGHTLTGSGTGNGVLIPEIIAATKINDITIKNCEISNFNRGINKSSTSGVGNTSNYSMISNTLHNNTDRGLFITRITGLTLTDNLSYSNGDDGFYVNVASDVTLTGNTLHSNGDRGFSLLSTSNGTVTGNTIYNNNPNGVQLQDTTDVTLTDNLSYSNARHGFYLLRTNDVTVTGNTSHSNGRNGFRIQRRGAGNMFTGNTSHSNGRHGFRIQQSAGNTLTNTLTGNISHDNSWNGFSIWRGDGNMITDNLVRDNAWNGFTIETGSDGNTFADNTIRGNAWAGINVRESVNNTITRNAIHKNTLGLSLYKASTTKVTLNDIWLNSPTGGIAVWSDPAIELSVNDVGNWWHGDCGKGLFVEGEDSNSLLVGKVIDSNPYRHAVAHIPDPNEPKSCPGS